MSADLLAEFGTGATSSAAEERLAQRQTSASAFPDLDPFGPIASTDHSHSLNGRESNPSVQTFAYYGPVSASGIGSNEKIWRRDGQGTDVLFDASTEDAANGDEDDWGEFETAPSPADNKLLDIETEYPSSRTSSTSRNNSNAINVSKTAASLQLLSLDNTISSTNVISTVSAVSNQHPQTRSTICSRAGPHQQDTLAKLSEEESAGEWGDFADGPEESQQTTSGDLFHRQTETVKVNPSTLSRFGQVQHAAESTNKPQNPRSEPDVRPTNIPPPSVLLQLFPSVLDELRERGAKVRRDPGSAAPNFALSLTSTLKVAARIIAGRTLRWKRDTLLSQSTKIGPARSGKAGGMKLSSVSKTESVKEEQEAVDVIEAWRRHAAFFNSIILSSGARPVPVVADKIPIETASPNQGALKASHACAICGLKRDERLPKIDENIEDSFGDWWVEHWGHTDCKRFWDENSRRLNQR
jgi:hypothetical protein